jgi:hypothetical protein
VCVCVLLQNASQSLAHIRMCACLWHTHAQLPPSLPSLPPSPPSPSFLPPLPSSLPQSLGPCLSSFATFVSRSPTTSLRPFSPLSPRGARGSPHGAPRTPQEIQPRDPPRGSLAALAADVYLQLPVGSSPAASAKKTKIWKISAIVLVPRKATVKWTLEN